MDPIVVEVPVAFKTASQCCARLFELVENARRAAAAGEPFAYADLERERPSLRGRAPAHRRRAASQGVRVTTTYYSVAEPVAVARWLYCPVEARDTPTVDPIAVRLGAVVGM